MTTPSDLLNRAADLAPVPDGDTDNTAPWVRHYAATAMAAWAAFRLAERTDPGPQLGFLALLGTAATAVITALSVTSEDAPRALWELNADGGEMNGESIEHLADVLEHHGINPADLYPWFEAGDFTAPTRLPKVEVA
ncbi:hypothetical protein GCM10010172_35200 [Paractinoplanes ferrugineus]|uniref:Uncharacterized protein n=1 Tax=Paractinoplanes ferrugineus TaxID=113564 RepID=A0A919MLF5_9ACTN|nr:hypothetical protein [Actinoplanes ferrugineus]GIE16770.1 hypothetical protein Afe05nite_86100 [Actinoplanes ferrugineus]